LVPQQKLAPALIQKDGAQIFPLLYNEADREKIPANEVDPVFLDTGLGDNQ
jgi:hypothetical protein